MKLFASNINTQTEDQSSFHTKTKAGEDDKGKTEGSGGQKERFFFIALCFLFSLFFKGDINSVGKIHSVSTCPQVKTSCCYQKPDPQSTMQTEPK